MKTITLRIKPADARNEMHFEVQQRTHAQVFRDHTKYTRKIKHKLREDY